MKKVFADEKSVMKKAMGFAQFKMEEYKEIGDEALNDKVEF